MIYSTIKLPKDLIIDLKAIAKASFRSLSKQIAFMINDYKKNNETAQKYCEREPLHTELLEAMDDMKTKKNFETYKSLQELLDAIPSR